MIDTLNITTEKVKHSRLPEVDFDNLVFGRIFSDHMFVADYRNGEWQNLEIRPYAPLNLSPALMALHYGQSIFEGMKAYRRENGEVVLFRPTENAARLNRSAKRMCMPEIPEEIFMGGLLKLLELDREWVPTQEGYSLYIRPFMFATDEFVGLKESMNYKFIIFTCPVGAYYSAPVSVKIETNFVRAAKGGTGFAKAAGNYAASLYPAKLAQADGYQQLIWTDAREHRYIEEAGTMNLMFRIGDTLLTAPTGDTILPGITRKSIMQLAQDWNIPLEERPVEVAEIVAAAQSGQLTEAFGMGTAATVSPIKLIAYEGEDYPIPPLSEERFGAKVKRYLIDLQQGKAADTHGWIHVV